MNTVGHPRAEKPIALPPSLLEALGRRIGELVGRRLAPLERRLEAQELTVARLAEAVDRRLATISEQEELAIAECLDRIRSAVVVFHRSPGSIGSGPLGGAGPQAFEPRAETESPGWERIE